MDINLSEKHAVVCGSTKGIGRACAMELASLGASVTLIARDEAGLRQTQAALPSRGGQKHSFGVADFSNPATVKAAIQGIVGATSGVHILINNTGGPPGGLAIDATPEQFTAAFSAHVVCNQILAQAVAPSMKRAGYGRIINIISTSVKEPIPGLGVSNTIRAAVANWAKTLSVELGPFGITVNNVLPGFTDTDRLQSLFAARATKSGSTPEKVAAEAMSKVPAGRFARAEETAAAVAFLASPAAAYINGINLPVDGGRLGCI